MHERQRERSIDDCSVLDCPSEYTVEALAKIDKMGLGLG